MTFLGLTELHRDCDNAQNAAISAYLSEGREGFDELKQIAHEKHLAYMAGYTEWKKARKR